VEVPTGTKQVVRLF